MNLYRISQTDAEGYDTYDSAVVAAESDVIAATMRPDGSYIPQEDNPYRPWTNDPSLVTVRYIGVAEEGTQRGVICASFNAG